MKIQQKITPHLWFDKEAKEAAEFYVSVFPGSKITDVTTLNDTPSGSADVVRFELMGQEFMAISAGPLFKFNESISFIVNCEPRLRSTITGASFPRCRKRSSAAGSRTSTVCRGRSFRTR